MHGTRHERRDDGPTAAGTRAPGEPVALCSTSARCRCGSGPADRPGCRSSAALAAAELDAIDALGRHLQKRQTGLAALGPFPPEFTDVNDVALHHLLLPKLVREQREAAADVEATLDQDRRGPRPAAGRTSAPQAAAAAGDWSH